MILLEAINFIGFSAGRLSVESNQKIALILVLLRFEIGWVVSDYSANLNIQYSVFNYSQIRLIGEKLF